MEHDPDRESQIAKVPFCQDNLVVVLPSNHPLAGEKRLKLTQLKGENFALIRKGTMPYSLCMRVCHDAGFTPRVIFTSHNLENLLDMVAEGNCVALLFEHHVAYPIDSVFSIAPPFAVVPITPKIQTTLYWGYLKNHTLSATRTFYRLLHIVNA